MIHQASAGFWKAYDALPAEVRQLADQNFILLKNNPHHPSLHFKKVGRYWSARVGIRYRALAVEEKDTLIWFWIGNHDEYDRMVGRSY